VSRRISAVSVLVRDYDDALAFYRDALGFEVLVDRNLGDGKRWIEVRPPGAETALLLAQASNPRQLAAVGNQTGGRVFLFLETDDFERDFAAMTAKGVRFVERPRREAYGTVAVFEDGSGNRWDLIQPTGADSD
jgi:catechol 2,3-dioxygenase-like lactoylglutathione lyase family enzyme